jgi:hypothetical protein
MNPKADQIRIRYLYRRFILDGDARISSLSAQRLVGPDCAYHLYSRIPRKDKLNPKTKRL